jgi:hypothetical protein
LLPFFVSSSPAELGKGQQSMAVQQEVIATYRDLMGDLAALPAQIATAKEAILPVRMRLAESKGAMDAIEDAYTPEGKNDSERKADRARFVAQHAAYQRFAAAAKKETADLAQLEINAEALEKQFIAVGFAARLHAGLMAYLAAAGAAPIVDVSFGMGKPANGTNGSGSNGNGNTVTAADAAALGL